MPTSLSKKKKDLIFDMSEGRCQYCGSDLDKSNRFSWHVDHVVSVNNGGNNDLDNLKLACNSCNSRKSGYSLDYFRGMMAINESEYKGVINYKQAEFLMSKGVVLNLPHYLFYYEGLNGER